MKRFKVRLTCDSQFSHGVVKAGTLVGIVTMVEPIEPTSLLSMIQFGQAAMEQTDSDESEVIESEPSNDVERDSSPVPETDHLSEEDDSEFDDETEQTDAPSDLTGILDESLIESLKLNGIETKAQLLEFLASGKDLVDLDKIGTTRAKRILAAVEGLK
jgi:hypothetical protein